MLSNKDIAIVMGIHNSKVVKRFNSKLSYQDNGCINFKSCNWDKDNAYGSFGISISKNKSVSVKPHRFAWALAYGFDKLPKGYFGGTKESLTINHKCHNHKCVNIEHLEVITMLENSMDGAEYAKTK